MIGLQGGAVDMTSSNQINVSFCENVTNPENYFVYSN